MRRFRRLLTEQLEVRQVLTGTLSGQVFTDLNADGVRQSGDGERAVGGAVVHLDTVPNGILDQRVAEFTRRGNPVDLNANGSRSVTLDVVAPGTYVVDVDVRLTIDNFFNDSLTVVLEAPSGEAVTIISSSDVDPRDVLLNDEARAEFIQLSDITGEMQPRNPLSRLDGAQASGRWRLTVTQNDGFVAPTLEDWSLIITSSVEPLTRTGSDGAFEFSDLEAGEYAVVASPPDDWEVEAEPTVVNASVVDGETTSVDIPTPLVQPSLSGRIWNDANANRIADATETGLAGWTVYLDTNDNQVLDEGERQTVTLADDPATPDQDEAGSYHFAELPPGDYNVQHIGPEGWLSYPLVTSDMPFERYAIRSSDELVRLNANDTGRRIADLPGFVSRMSDFTYSPTEDKFYGITVFGELIQFETNGSDATDLGPLVWEDRNLVVNGIASNSQGVLYVVGPEGFFLVNSENAQVQRIGPNDSSIELIDFDVDGRLIGYQRSSPAGPQFVQLDLNTGEILEVLASDVPTRSVDSIDVLPNGEVFTAGGFRETRSYTLDGQLVRARSFTSSQSTPDAASSIPAGSWRDLEVALDQVPTQVDFAAFLPSTISGRLTLVDEEGTATGLGGVRIYLDRNENQQFDIGEASTITDPNVPDSDETQAGNYRIENLPAGSYSVRQVLPSNLDQLSPSDGHTVVLGDGEDASDVDFENQLGPSFQGYVYLDADGDGSEQSVEARLSEITVFIDLDDNGILDREEPMSVADEEGAFYFGPLTSKDYVLRQILPQGWLGTQPSNDGPATITFPRDEAEPIVFGQVRGGVITGRVYHDVNADGMAKPFDRTLEGVRVFLDANGNGAWDEGERSTETDADGYRFETLPAGNYQVATELVPGYEPSTSRSVSIDLALDQDIAGIDFGMAPLPGVISGFRWNDLNANGRREVGEPGISGREVYLDLNNDGVRGPDEPLTTTRDFDPAVPEVDESGYYEFTGVAPGRYTIREIAEPGFVQTFPSIENRNTLENRIYLVNLEAAAIQELDEAGRVVGSFPVPDDLSRFNSVSLTAGPDSLFYVNRSMNPDVLWEIDPVDGRVIDSDELDVRVTDISYYDGQVFLLSTGGSISSFDLKTDTVSAAPTGSFFSSGLAVLDGPEQIVQYSRTDLQVSTFESSNRVTLDVETEFRSITSLGTNGSDIWTIVRGEILAFDRRGNLIDEISLDPFSDYGAIAVGKLPEVDLDEHVITLGPGETKRDLNFGNVDQPRGTAFGVVWNDGDLNGLRSTEEAGAAELDVVFRSTTGDQERITTSLDSLITSDRDESGQFSVPLLPGTYRVTIEQGGEPVEVTNTFSSVGDLATAGQVYQLVEKTPGRLVIELRDLAQNLLRELELPEAPQHVGPQAIAIHQDSLVYVDGSGGASARVWRLELETGNVLDLSVVQPETLTSISAAVIASGRVRLGGDGNVLVDIESGSGENIALDFVGGAAYDPSSQTLILSGSQAGIPKFAKTTADGFEYFDAPVFAETGGIAVVNGELLVPENGNSNTLARYDLERFERLGEVAWEQTAQVINLTSITSWGNSKYITVDLDSPPAGLSIGVVEPVPRDAADINRDGTVDALDAEAIHAAIEGQVDLDPRMDINLDGVVDALDINEIANRLNAPVGDANLNGVVDFADFLVIAGNFGKEVRCGWLDGDFDGNGRIEFADFLVTAANFGNS